MTPRPLPVIVASLAASLAIGCSAVQTPSPGSHAWRGQDGHEEPVEVPTSPPPGKVAIIPAKPAGIAHPVWVDGQWVWSGRGWLWKEGGWEEQASGRYYASPIFARLDDGTLVYKPGRWTSFPAEK